MLFSVSAYDFCLFLFNLSFLEKNVMLEFAKEPLHVHQWDEPVNWDLGTSARSPVLQGVQRMTESRFFRSGQYRKARDKPDLLGSPGIRKALWREAECWGAQLTVAASRLEGRTCIRTVDQLCSLGLWWRRVMSPLSPGWKCRTLFYYNLDVLSLGTYTATWKLAELVLSRQSGLRGFSQDTC